MSKIQQIIESSVQVVRTNAPKDTGNLAYNAVKGQWKSANTFEIYVDLGVADYMPYTEEKWQNGKNPNEGWFKRTSRDVAEDIAKKLGGRLS